MCAPRRPALLVVKPALCSRPVGQAVSSIHAHGMTKPAPSVVSAEGDEGSVGGARAVVSRRSHLRAPPALPCTLQAAPQPRANGICCASSASATPYAGFTSGIASALHVLSKRAVQLQAERRSLPQQDEVSGGRCMQGIL